MPLFKRLVVTFIVLGSMACWIAPALGGSAKNRNEGLLSKVWWNQPGKIKELGLTEAQRLEMDAALTICIEERKKYTRLSRERFAAFGKALAGGDREKTRILRDGLVEMMATPMRIQVDMMMAVVETMTPEQVKKLTSLYPNLLSRPWIRPICPRVTAPRGTVNAMGNRQKK